MLLVLILDPLRNIHLRLFDLALGSKVQLTPAPRLLRLHHLVCVLATQVDKVAQAVAFPYLFRILQEVWRGFFEGDELVDTAFFQDGFGVTVG